MAVAEHLPLIRTGGGAALAPRRWPEAVRIVVRLSAEEDRSTAGSLATKLVSAAALGQGEVVVEQGAAVVAGRNGSRVTPRPG